MNIKFDPDINTGQICKNYYEHEIFDTDVGFELGVISEIVKADASAKYVDFCIFTHELIALNIELFGLAWFAHNYELFEEEKLESNKLDTLELTEIWFTKSYLKRLDENDIWSAMGFYNEIILQAAIAQKASMDWSIPRDIPGYYFERGANSSAEKLEKEQFDNFFGHFMKKLVDTECCTILANRLVSCDCLQKGIMIPQKLSSAFCQRLNFTPNLEALLLIQRIIVGLYNSAMGLINSAEEYGSYELARKAAKDLRAHMIEVLKND